MCPDIEDASEPQVIRNSSGSVMHRDPSLAGVLKSTTELTGELEPLLEKAESWTEGEQLVLSSAVFEA